MYDADDDDDDVDDIGEFAETSNTYKYLFLSNECTLPATSFLWPTSP
jgi:hypothetical protein